MAWLFTIIRLLIALPQLISLFREFGDLIKELPKSEQKEAKSHLVELAKKAKTNKNVVSSRSEIEQYRDELRNRVASRSKV